MLSRLLFYIALIVASPGLLSFAIGALLACPFWFVAMAIVVLNDELDDEDEVFY